LNPRRPTPEDLLGNHINKECVWKPCEDRIENTENERINIDQLLKDFGRIAFDKGNVNIHTVSALSIEKVEIVQGRDVPINILIHMNNSAGIFQIQETLGKKSIMDSPLENYVEVIATTTIGLSMGFVETHPQYHPFKALAIFWGAITVLTVTLPKTRIWRIGINALALLPYLGAINNTLVILGIFPGLQI